MGDKDLLKKNNIFSKIANWFSNLGKKNDVFENKKEQLEFKSQKNAVDNEPVEFSGNPEKLKYEFSTQTVSKQKIEKIRTELDNGKIGFEELYQLSENEIEELDKSYDNQINDTVLKLQEVSRTLEGYQRKLAKIQNTEE